MDLGDQIRALIGLRMHVLHVLHSMTKKEGEAISVQVLLSRPIQAK